MGRGETHGEKAAPSKLISGHLLQNDQYSSVRYEYHEANLPAFVQIAGMLMIMKK